VNLLFLLYSKSIFIFCFIQKAFLYFALFKNYFLFLLFVKTIL